MIRRRRRNYDDPLCHADHARPRTRREFLAQGFIAGSGIALGMTQTTIGGKAFALSPDLAALISGCDIQTNGAGKIPFIAFDLAGGSNQAGSNVLVGQRGGQLDFLSTQGYERQGLPGDMVPSIANPDTGLSDFINDSLGLAFHSDSAFLRGMLKLVAHHHGEHQWRGDTGAVGKRHRQQPPQPDVRDCPGGRQRLTADSGRFGELRLRRPFHGAHGSDRSVDPPDQGGPSLGRDLAGRRGRPDQRAQPAGRGRGHGVHLPHQRPEDAQRRRAIVTTDEVVKDLVRCGYLKSADLAERFGDPTTLDPAGDPEIVGAAGIFSAAENST